MLFREYQKMVFISPMSLIFFSLIHGYVTISPAWCNTIQEPNNIYLISTFQLNTVMHYLRSTIKLNTLFFFFSEFTFSKVFRKQTPNSAIIISSYSHMWNCHYFQSPDSSLFFTKNSLYNFIIDNFQNTIWNMMKIGRTSISNNCLS